MTDLNDLRAALPIEAIASRLGEDPDAVRQAVDLALPALLGGLKANADDPAGEASLTEALTQHDNDLASGTINVGDVDVADGQKIAAHIFGANQEQVINQLGSTGVSSSLLSKLIPILAPIVLSYVAKQVGGGAGGGILGSILSSVLGGAASGAGTPSTGSAASGIDAGSILGDVLGGLLGGGRKA